MKVKCPNCKKDVEWKETNKFRPFCSERCKLIDLGAWASGEYAIPTINSNPADNNNDEFDEDEHTQSN